MSRALFIAATLAVLFSLAPAVGTSQEPLDVPPAPWIDDCEHEGIVYFLYSHPARLERFDLDARIWLPALTLPQTPSVFDIGDDGIFVGFRSGLVSRFDHLGGSELTLIEKNAIASSVTVIGDVLLVIFNGKQDAYTFSTGAGSLIDYDDSFYDQMVAIAPAPPTHRVFGRLNGRPGYLELGPYGRLGLQEQISSQNLSSEDAWSAPNSSYVVFDNGSMWFTNPADSMPVDLGGPLDGLVFHDQLPIVLRDDRLIGYSRSFHRTGEIITDLAVRRIYLYGNELALFSLGTSGVEVTWVPIAGLDLPPANEPVDPRGLAFAPDDLDVDHRGIIYLLSSTYASIFRFSTSSGSYLETIPTNDRATMIAYSPIDDSLFIGYESGEVTRFDLAPDGTPSLENSHLSLPLPLRGLSAADEYLVTAEHDGSWTTLRSHNGTGAEVSNTEVSDQLHDFQWCATTRKFYSAAYDWLYGHPIDANGAIGAELSSGYDSSIEAPVHVSHDGSRVLVKRGEIFDGDSLDLLDEIGASHLDAAWIGSQIVTVVEDGGDSRLIAYASDLSVVGERIVPGGPIGLIREGDGIVLVSENPSGRPALTHWSAELVSTDLQIHVDDGLNHVGAGESISWSVSISSLAQGPTTNLAVTSDSSVVLSDLSWTCSATSPSACGDPTGTGALNDTATVDPAGTLEYDVTATVPPSAQGTARFTVRVEPTSGPGWEDSDLTEIRVPLEIFSDTFEDATADAWTEMMP